MALSTKKLLKRLRNKCRKLWRERVFEKWGGVCVVCGSRKLPNCHHIVPKEPPQFAALRYDPLNGIVLCPIHHKFGRFSAHKNPLWFVTNVLMLKVSVDTLEYLQRRMHEQQLITFTIEEYQKIIEKLESTQEIET